MTDEEEVTARLLRLAVAVDDPPVNRVARVRSVVHREWRAGRRRRMIRRGAAAAALGLAAALAIVFRLMSPAGVAVPANVPVVATGQLVQGTPVVRPRQHPDSRYPLAASTPIHEGDGVETDNASRASLQMIDGSSVRIDRASRVGFPAPSVIEVMAGAIYVATSEGSRGLEVRTALGTVRDTGTRFEVRVEESSLRVRVRAGAVEVRRGSAVTAAPAGTEATVTSAGVVTRPVRADGPDWMWTTELAPRLAMEGQTLQAFLEHIAGEQGWTVHYSDPQLAAAAARIVLHGSSIEGLQAEQALDVALAASGLQHTLREGRLVVSRPAATR